LIIVVFMICSVSTDVVCSESRIQPAIRGDSGLVRVAESMGGAIGLENKSVSGDEKRSNGRDSKRTRKVNRAPDGLGRKRSQDEPSGTPKIFRNPTLRGVGVDWCMSADLGGCGQVAATTWCRSKGLSKATDFKWKAMSPVYRQGDENICNGFCGGFTQVTCE
jgi:hypothetical protein